MSIIDWLVVCLTLLAIVLYGVWQSRKARGMEVYMRGDRQQNWFTIGLSVMATQASAITFLSTPGQAYQSGMGFVQFYFGLPIAMILVSQYIVPLFYKSNVYTAYEYLEQRYDLRVRLLTSFLFLVQRGLAAGITIYAPAIVLSSALGWHLDLLIVGIGILVIAYTVSGGTRAVSLTQKWQMAVIMGGVFYAFFWLLISLNETTGVAAAIDIAARAGKLEVISFDLDVESRYTIWSGLLGGTFLSLAYFGTDQSQVQRYISARNLDESRMALMMNALLKIPMQTIILLLGVLLYVFYTSHPQPIAFDSARVEQLLAKDHSGQAARLVNDFDRLEQVRLARGADELLPRQIELRNEMNHLSQELNVRSKTPDSDFVFIRFVLDHLPHGITGLLLAVILSAGMSSTAGELNALSVSSVRDYYQRLGLGPNSGDNPLAARLLTAFWGILAILAALWMQMFENLIELVNILGSLFYGTILGVFVCAIWLRKSTAIAVTYAAIAAQTTVLLFYFLLRNEIGFLWYNAIGTMTVVLLAWLISVIGVNMEIKRNSS